MSDREQSPTGEHEAAVAPNHINLKVTDNHTEIFFKIKRTTRLEKLMQAFCDRTGKDLRATRFFVDGDRVEKEQTPNDLDMEDGDALEAFQEQLGGFCL